MPLIPMSSMLNSDEQLRALNMIGNYSNLAHNYWLGDSGSLGFYGDQTPHQLGLFGSKKKKKDSADQVSSKLPEIMAKKQDSTQSSGGGGSSILIVGGVLLAGGFLIYSLTKKKKADEKVPETKPIFRRQFKLRTKAIGTQNT